MKIQILSSAMKDLNTGKDFYDCQEAGIGDYFQDCLFCDIDSHILYGGIHKQVFGYHRLLSKRFPYAIYYRIDQTHTITVHRVLDCRREPSKTRGALNLSFKDPD